MSRMTHANSFANRLGCRTKWPWLCGLLGLLLAPAALATDPLYENDAVHYYTVPGSPPPTIDAVNFVNTSVFSVALNNLVTLVTIDYYEPWNVRNYTNTGTMSVSSDEPLHYFPGLGIYEGIVPTFQFDTQTNRIFSKPHQMAGSFYNSGEIDAEGQLIVRATNIVNPGNIVMMGQYVDPVIKFTGGNVDLTRAKLTVGNLQSESSGITLAVYSSAWSFGVDTNQEWNPGGALGSTFAYSSWSGGGAYPVGYYLRDTASTPYLDFQFPNTNLTVIRAVFVQDTSPNIVATHVYFDPLSGSGLYDAPARVEWVGAAGNSLTCATTTNHLYLTDYYVLGGSTNVNMDYTSGAPDNFTFATSATPLFFGPAGPGFIPVFPYNLVTNTYSYFNGQIIATTAPTNATTANPSGAVTNLPGRIQITAGNELNLNLASISGQDYLSLTCTNQFDGSIGARISAPFSDISLGVTNGFMVVTNLLEATIPNWNGYVAGWSARWLTVVTNTIGTNSFTATNDYRVLIVNSSQLTPVSEPQVRNLTLHATNSLVITDLLNVFGSLFLDPQNLTLTTNGCGNGATSFEGELNLMSDGILWQSALPNVRNLTNNGAIHTKNLSVFGSATAGYITNSTPATPAVAATGTLSEVITSGNVAVSNTVTIGTNTYIFVGSISNKVANQVKIAATLDGSMSNLIAAINHAAGSGTSYSTNGTTNRFVKAGLLSNHSFTVTARTNGSSGNSIVTTESTATTNLTWNGQATLSGGADYVAGTTNISTVSGAYDNFINHGLISDQGSTIYANNFLSSGIISNGVGSFLLQSLATVLTNGAITAGGDVSITTGSLVTSNLMLLAGRSLTLQVTNYLTDNGVSNGNFWSVGSSGVGGSDSGFNLLLLPNSASQCDLLGTTVTNIAPPNKHIINTWAGRDYGISPAGYTNNVAIGRLILDSRTNAPYSLFTFNGAGGAGVSNAIYVDELILFHYASYTNADLNGNLPALDINTNLTGGLVIYYAQALAAGPGGQMVSVAEKLNHKNNDRLRWLWMYAGHFSSTNIVYPDGTTNGPFNAALASSKDIDSDGDGIVNASDPTPFYVQSEVNFTQTMVNRPPLSVLLQWTTIPLATNYIYYRTNLLSPTWLPLTNFDNYYYGANVAVTNSAHVNSFVSPQPWPSIATNVWVFDPATNGLRYYRVMVNPWLTYPY
jgi:hypothetical protein